MKRTVRQRLTANRLWHQNTVALMHDTTVNTTTGGQMKLVPDNPAEDRAEAAAWKEGAAMLDKLNEQRKATGELPLRVNMDNAPALVRAELQEARRREEADELARIQERTRELELQAAESRGEIKGLERKTR